MTTFAEPPEKSPSPQQKQIGAKSMARSYSMPPATHVPAPPPMPPQEDEPMTPGGTLKRNMAAVGTMAGN